MESSKYNLAERGAMEDRVFTPQVMVLVFLSFMMGTSEFIVMGILPDMADDLGLPYTTIGNLVSIFAIGYALLTPVITAAVSRYSRYRMLVLFSVLFLVANLWTMVSSDYASIALSRILTAAVSGSLLGVGLTFVMDLVTPRFRPKAVAWVYAGFSISSVFGIPLGTVVSHTMGWRSVFVLILVMGVIGTAAAARLLPRLPAPETRGSGRGGVANLLKDSRILFGVLVTVFGAMGYYTVYTYITPILQTEIGLEGAAVSIGLMVMGVTMLISNIASGKVAERRGMRILAFSYILEAAVLFVLPTAVADPVAGMAALICFGLLVYIMNAPVQVHLLEVSSRDYPESMTFASALNPSVFNIGIAIGSFVGGLAFDAFGLNSIGYFGGVALLAGSAMAFATCFVCRGEGRGTSVT